MSKTSTLLDLLCSQRQQMKVVIAVLIACGLMLGLAALVVSPGDEAWPILVIDAVLVVGGFALFSGTYWYCTKRAMSE
jgi:phosphotransferase system  glucose/maltose/N-acetylglucosamine-specific IIC component